MGHLASSGAAEKAVFDSGALAVAAASWWCWCIGRSQWSIATAWQETALPVPVHAAAIIGESMDENRARITVMAKDRRILQRHYTFIFPENNWIQSC